MSQKSLKNKPKTTKTTPTAFTVKKRSVGVFNSASEAKVRDTVWLYRIVFSSKRVISFTAFLCLCFVAQPFNFVFASEVDETKAVVSIEPAPTITIEEVKPIVVAEAGPANVQDKTTISDVVVTGAEVGEIRSGTTELISPDQTTIDQTHATFSDPVVITPVATPEPTITEPQTLSDTPEMVETAENIIDPFYYYGDTETVSTDPRDSEGQFIENLNVVAVVESDTAFSFGRDECTRIEDGSFYCQEKTREMPRNNTLTAAPDVDGDLEIYLVQDGEQTQITRNTVDDASPYFDEKSKTLVWHRLVDDRYQIISYNPETGEELQITQGVINNMEPARQGDAVVWQRWVEDNWEIILYDGQRELQITTSVEHDTAPHLNGNLIIWNSQALDGSRALKTYDLETQSFTTISDDEGVAVSNPRMVVMYEAMYENGDIVMKGFDIVTGEIIPIQAFPRELPEGIPSSDSTGVTRALIQNKPNLREGFSENDETIDPVIVPVLPEPDEYILDLRSSITANNTTSEPQMNENIPELIVPPYLDTVSTSSTQVE